MSGISWAILLLLQLVVVVVMEVVVVAAAAALSMSILLPKVGNFWTKFLRKIIRLGVRRTAAE